MFFPLANSNATGDGFIPGPTTLRRRRLSASSPISFVSITTSPRVRRFSYAAIYRAITRRRLSSLHCRHPPKSTEITRHSSRSHLEHQ